MKSRPAGSQAGAAAVGRSPAGAAQQQAADLLQGPAGLEGVGELAKDLRRRAGDDDVHGGVVEVLGAEGAVQAARDRDDPGVERLDRPQDRDAGRVLGRDEGQAHERGPLPLEPGADELRGGRGRGVEVVDPLHLAERDVVTAAHRGGEGQQPERRPDEPAVDVALRVLRRVVEDGVVRRTRRVDEEDLHAGTRSTSRRAAARRSRRSTTASTSPISTGFLGVHEAAREQQFDGAPAAHELRQPHRAAAARHQVERRLRKREDRVRGGNPPAAGQREFEAAAETAAADGRHGGVRQLRDRLEARGRGRGESCAASAGCAPARPAFSAPMSAPEEKWRPAPWTTSPRTGRSLSVPTSAARVWKNPWSISLRGGASRTRRAISPSGSRASRRDPSLPTRHPHEQLRLAPQRLGQRQPPGVAERLHDGADLGDGALAHQAVEVVAGTLLQRGRGADAIHDAETVGLRRADHAPREQQVDGGPPRGDAVEEERPAESRDEAQLDFGEPEQAARGGEAEVAAEGDLEAGAEAAAADQRENRDRGVGEKREEFLPAVQLALETRGAQLLAAAFRDRRRERSACPPPGGSAPSAPGDPGRAPPASARRTAAGRTCCAAGSTARACRCRPRRG